MTKINLNKFKEAIKGTGGNITQIAQILGCRRKAVYEFMDKHPETKQWVEEECELPFDVAENVVKKHLNENDLNAAKMMLFGHKRGRARGWGDKIEMEMSGEIKTKGILQEAYEKAYGKPTGTENAGSPDK